MSIEFVLMVGVLVCSVFTGLIVEAIKKMTSAEGRPTNLIAAVVSVIVGIIYLFLWFSQNLDWMNMGLLV